jgi:transcriptional regulator with PAS, ATPase and Fis domain
VKEKRFVSNEELRIRKAENFVYLATAKTLLENFFSVDNPFFISFVDKDGVVLLSIGPKDKTPLFPEGTVINSATGKVAILSALKNKKPAEVIGVEHTDETLSLWSCAAAPVFDEKGDVAFVLDLSAPNKDYPKYAIGIVSALAKSIENEVKLKNALKKVELTKKFSEVISEGNEDGVLVLDKDAKVLYINKRGADILRVKRDSSIGKYVADIVDFPPVILRVFKTHKGYVDKEFIINSPSRGILHFVKTAVVLRNSEGDFVGVVDFFREIKRVRAFVTQYIGAEARFTFDDIVGDSPKLKEAMRIAKIAAQTSSSILIQGETGTGKEMFAQAIHFASHFSKGPFVALNCGAVPRDLAESELFGYEPGAFTDASKNGRPGKFELADGGTLFLDEIEELPPAIQTKLLRVIENKVITRVGGTKSLKVNVRIIAATNKDLEELIKSNNFRRDLYYRLNVIQIFIPPLRERKEDIPLLVEHFLKGFSAEFGKEITRVDKSFIEPLMNYDFPGNVRELQNIVERAVSLASSNVLTGDLLPKDILSKKSATVNLLQLKKEAVLSALKSANFNISLASKKLGVSRPTMYKLIREFHIELFH